MTTIRTQALVLRSIPFGDSDRIVTLLSREGGKTGALAKGAQKSRKRFAGCLELGSLLDVDLTAAPGRQLLSIQRAEVQRSYVSLAQDLEAFGRLSYALELVRECCPERETDRVLFDLLVAYLESLRQNNTLALLRVFEFALLVHLGYAPDFLRCRDCREPTKGLSSFHARFGGIRCERCDPEAKGAILLGLGTASTLATLQQEAGAQLQHLGHTDWLETMPVLTAPTTRVSPRILQEAGRIVTKHLEHILGKSMRSLAFLENPLAL